MHTVTEIEERIRQRYHQPKGVEQFGIEPVPSELKTVRWHDIFAIIFGFALNPGSMLVGGMAVISGLSFWGAIGAITGGVLLATIAYTITATVGVDYGLPGQVSMRMVYGLRGAKWVPSFLRTIASTYWFAYQTVAGSLAVVAILDRWTGTPHSLVAVSIIFAVLQAIVALIGYDSLKHLSRIALPFKILILSFVLVLLGTHSDPNFAPAQVFHYAGKPESGWLLFVTWMNVVAAGSLTMVTDSADFCRYTRSRTDMWWGTLLGKVGGGAFAASLGAYGAAATLGKTANVFEVAAQLTASWFVLLLFLIVIALDNWTINVLNLYTGGLSLSNIFERLGRFWTTLVISVVGIVLSAIPDVATGYTTYVGILGNVFSPIAGVLIADYLLVKGMRIDLAALFETKGRYWYWHGVNPIAVIWTALGFLAYMFVIPAEWIRVLVTLSATGVGYWATMHLLAPHFPQLALASHPGEQREPIEDLDWQLALR
ncbi:MAG: cytosine permease [Alphaproteobacteria bacterium]|nr:cytosine permease [Alphaproteobacteria bacterium]MBV9201326.1 cytosine permease [Alphaproteobacteria bacterium]